MRLSRVPECNVETIEGMRSWFDALHERGLMFHPEDAPDQIVSGLAGVRVFSDAECKELARTMRALFAKHGGAVCSVALAAIGGVDDDDESNQ